MSRLSALRAALGFLGNLALLVILVNIALSAEDFPFSDHVITAEVLIAIVAVLLAVDRLRLLVRALFPPSTGAGLGGTALADGAMPLGVAGQLHRSLEVRARHEAAHAVAVHVLGHRIDAVSVSITGRSGGRVSWTHHEGVLASIDHVIVCFIGPLAERTGDVMPVSPRADDDYSVMLRTAIAASITDPEERSVVDVLEVASEKARKILRDHRAEIEALTDALVATDGTQDLSVDEVLATVQGTTAEQATPTT